MPLREARIPVVFRGGVDTESDPKTVLPTQLVALENGQFNKRGTIGKRHGHENLGSEQLGIAGAAEVSVGDGVALGTRNSELLRFGESKVHSYQDDVNKWVLAGQIECPVLRHRAVAGTPQKQLRAGYAAVNGIGVYAWIQTGGIYYTVVDADTDRTIVAPTQLDADGVTAYVYGIGSHIHITYFTTAPALKCAVISPDNPAAGAIYTNTLYTTEIDGAASVIDVFADGTAALFAFWVSGSNTVRFGHISEDGFVGSPLRGLPSPVDHAAGGALDAGGPTICRDTSGAGSVFIAYATGNTVRWAMYNSAFAAVQADQLLGGLNPPTRMTSLFQAPSDTFGRRTVRLYVEISGAVEYWYCADDGDENQEGTYYGDNLSHRPFARGDYVYLPTQFDSTLWSTFFVRRHDGLIVARFLSGQAEGRPAKEYNALPSVSGDVVTIPCVWRLRLESEDNDQYTEESIRSVTLDFGASDRCQSAQLGESTYVAGAGFLWQYDGEGCTEAGFFYAPDDVAAPTQSVDTGQLTTTGVYSYVFAYGWKNSRGEIDWGPTSAATQVTLTGSNETLDWSIPSYRHTMKTSPRGECFVGVFRTEDAGATYYLVSSHDPSATGANGYVANDPSSATVTFQDKLSDAALVTRELLYTTGGVLSNDGWENGSALASTKGRIFTADAANPDLVRYSQQHRDLYTLEQPGLLSIKPDPDGGSIKGIAGMDDSVIIFRERAIYHVAGPGPLANPALGGGFTEPQLITTDVGCRDQRTIANTPAGLVFDSSKGIHLLDRGRQVRYIGAPVEAYNSQTFVSAELIPDRTQVRFLTNSGLSLLWDYSVDQWSTMTNHEGVSAVISGGTYHYLRNNGDVYRESTSYVDDSKRIPLGIETAWIKLAGYLQGWQKIWRVTVIGEYKSAHVLRMYYQLDYENGWHDAPYEYDPSTHRDTASYGAGVYGAGPYGGSGEVRYQFTVHIGATCQAIRFRFEDFETSTNGAAFELTEMLITGGVRGPRAHLRAERML